LDAAHEMLSVLRRAGDYLSAGQYLDADGQDILEEIQAAIAKAEGRL